VELRVLLSSQQKGSLKRLEERGGRRGVRAEAINMESVKKSI
jgi:hypothetical protein